MILRLKFLDYLPVNISQHFVPSDPVEGKVRWSEHSEGPPGLEA